ncbi:MAG: hypothetical protein J6X26_02175 [Bacteroidales bacterium]|nr:hypothetical protein [Bacteroidales bacterium]
MNYQELDNLITFKMGVPSLYHIMLGMYEKDTGCFEYELTTRETDNYKLNIFLKKYNVNVERTSITLDHRVHEITVTIPYKKIEKTDPILLFNYFLHRTNFVVTHFQLDLETDNCQRALFIIIHSNYYDIQITKERYEDEKDMDYIVIKFKTYDIFIDKLHCLAIIANDGFYN